MTTKHDVLRVHTENPTWTSTEIAAALGCHSAYVRATAQRNGLSLPVGQGGYNGPRAARAPGEPRVNLRNIAKAATRAKAIAAARKLWDAPGTYETQGIREIAAEMGMTTGSIFANFASKADLWREAMGYEPPVDGPEVRAVLQRAAMMREAA